jgi:hypothetical protein
VLFIEEPLVWNVALYQRYEWLEGVACHPVEAITIALAQAGCLLCAIILDILYSNEITASAGLYRRTKLLTLKSLRRPMS